MLKPWAPRHPPHTTTDLSAWAIRGWIKARLVTHFVIAREACGSLRTALGLGSRQGWTDSELMLTVLSTGLRFRLALMLAAFAALCFLAPPAVLASGHGENAVHCLAHADAVDHGTTIAHGIKHHGDHSSPAGHQSSCCGLFCMSALAPEPGQTVDRIDVSPVLSPAIEARLFSRVPETPDRPPIPVLFV